MTPAQIMTPRGFWRDVPIWERRDVTVCIAATCEKEKGGPNSIVFCTDYRMSGPLGTSELKSKDHLIKEGWVCLISGYESEALAIVILLKKHFRATDVIDETNVKALVQKALNDRKREKIEELIQGKLAISYEDFLRFGKEKLPPDYYRDIVTSISDIIVPAPCIIGGFSQGQPILLETTETCRVMIKEDFVTVGEGSHLATASLLQRVQIRVASLNETLYAVYEAKKYAGNVISVGPHTALMVLHGDLSWHRINMAGDAIANIFESKYAKHGPHKLPIKIFSDDEIKTILETS